MNSIRRELTLFDSVCILVGIIVGAGIYETAPTVAGSMGGWLETILIWFVGGLLALTGALCYAELATAYPYEGGDYVYLSRAYGRWAGYLFGWSQILIIRPGDIALLSFVFARYAKALYDIGENSLLIYASSAVIILTLINALGIRSGKWMQNLLTVVKALGITSIIVAGLLSRNPLPSPEAGLNQNLNIRLALILVLFTFGGWNEMAYVAGEVKKPQKNIVRSLFIAVALVTILYILINSAFIYSLGYYNMVTSKAVAVDTMSVVFPEVAGKIVAILICISTLGAVNGLTLTGARIPYAMGTEHNLFRHLGGWNYRFNTPTRALIFQGSLSLMIVILARSFIDTILYTAPVVWLFFLATSLSLFVLRRKEPFTSRPYKVLGYPVTNLLFSACCIFMLYSSTSYAIDFKPISFIILLSCLALGAITYILPKPKR